MLRKIDNCQLCPLHKYRTNIVWNYVPKESWNGLVLIGEAPGEDEDRQAEPFVGRAGKILDECLKEAGIKRSETYISNIVKCRPPENNIKHPDALMALDICPSHFLSAELDNSQIRLIVSMGGTALKFFTGETQVLKNKSKIWSASGGLYSELLTTIHPSFVLRGGARREDLIIDFKKARKLIEC